MSLKGQSFSNTVADSAHMTFGVGAAANVFTNGYTIAALAKFTSSNWGMIAGYSDSDGGTGQGALFASNNGGGQLYSLADFSAGYPGGSGINDGVWRWVAMCKPAGSAHYRYHVADLATLTWSHGESASSANHGDGSAVTLFSTYAIYGQGFDAGDLAAIALWDSQLSDSAIEAALTQAATALAASTPIVGWLMPEATSGSSLSDFTGGGANEASRQNMATSPDPTDFNFTLSAPFAGGMFLPFF